MKKAIFLLPILLLPTLLSIGCGSSGKVDPILLLSAAEALEQGKALLEAEKYSKAQALLTHAFEVEPNSRSGREALLLSANAFYLQGGPQNYIKCEAKYRDFLNRFPTSDRSDYAQFQVANCLARRVERPDRDQKVTVQAQQAYEELLRLYPASSYADQTREEIVRVNEQLASHELVIADFYLHYGICVASIRRLEYLQENFPNFERMDEALALFVQSYAACNRMDESNQSLEELRLKYPQSPILDGLEKKQQHWLKKSEKYAKQNAKKNAKYTPKKRP